MLGFFGVLSNGIWAIFKQLYLTPQQVLPIQIRVKLGVMAIKGVFHTL